MGLSKKPIQVREPQGWEGRLWHPIAAAALGTPLASANIERQSTSGNRPPFLICKFGSVGSCNQETRRPNSIGFAVPLLIAILLVAFISASAHSKLDEYEGRTIASIEITFEGSPSDPAAEADGEETAEFFEGCLSVPGESFPTGRADWARVTARPPDNAVAKRAKTRVLIFILRGSGA